MFIRSFRFKGGRGGNSRVFRSSKSNGGIDGNWRSRSWTQVDFPDDLAQEEAKHLAALENDALAIEHENGLTKEQEIADEMHAIGDTEVSGLANSHNADFLAGTFRMEYLCLFCPLQTVHVMPTNYTNLSNLFGFQQGTSPLLALRITLQSTLLAWCVVVCNMQAVSSFGRPAFGMTSLIQTNQGGTYRCMSLPDEGCDRSNLVHSVYQLRMATS